MIYKKTIGSLRRAADGTTCAEDAVYLSLYLSCTFLALSAATTVARGCR